MKASVKNVEKEGFLMIRHGPIKAFLAIVLDSKVKEDGMGM